MEVSANIGNDTAQASRGSPCRPPTRAPGLIPDLPTYGSSTPFQRTLVQAGLVDNVTCEHTPGTARGPLPISVDIAEKKKAKDVQAVIDAELRTLATQGPAEKKMENARARWRTRTLFSLETSEGRARALARAAATGPLPLPFDWL
ncbi:MAG: hypothetical protein R3F14_09725 [Polyangiaceae bacterium]